MASFSVVSNIASNNAQANLYGTQVGLQKALTRLSSGFRINVSGDDAAGLAVANSYRNDNAVITQGIRNANDGLSVLQVKDGALGNVSTLLDRLSTLATQAASAGTSGVSTGTLKAEADDIVSEISRELQVAGMDSTQSFSVFISNDGSGSATTAAPVSANVDLSTALLDGTFAGGGAAATLVAATDFHFAAMDADHAAVDVTFADPTNTAAEKFAQIKYALESEYGADAVQLTAADLSAPTAADTFTVTVASTRTVNKGEVTGTVQKIDLGTGTSDANTLYLGIQKADGSFLDLNTAAASGTAVAQVKSALSSIGTAQGTIGTLQNKLQFAVGLAQSQQVNKKAAESRIRDANIAEESANMTRYNILTQSGIAALAQANQSTSSVLSLLR